MAEKLAFNDTLTHTVDMYQHRTKRVIFGNSFFRLMNFMTSSLGNVNLMIRLFLFFAYHKAGIQYISLIYLRCKKSHFPLI